ncbi:conserved domain protein [Paenibacillus sp. HGF5]|nr:conserved domain protein [Paenibacillus sp. HGF5]
MIFMEMETVKLSQIVMKWFPEMIPFFRQNELNSMIVLRDGLSILEQEDALEIIQFSICEHQNQTPLH